MQSAFSLERQVTKIANVTLTYLNSRGVHQFMSLDANAPTAGHTVLSWAAPVPEPEATSINTLPTEFSGRTS